jgi:hypothetical protein
LEVAVWTDDQLPEDVTPVAALTMVTGRSWTSKMTPVRA